MTATGYFRRQNQIHPACRCGHVELFAGLSHCDKWRRVLWGERFSCQWMNSICYVSVSDDQFIDENQITKADNSEKREPNTKLTTAGASEDPHWNV